MRIALNLLYVRPLVVGGTAIYARGLMEGLAACCPQHEYFAFLPREAAEWPLPSSRIQRIDCDVVATSQARRYAYEQLRLPRQLRELDIDLIHSPGYVTPLMAHCRTVVTIHDMTFRTLAASTPFLRRTALEIFVRGAIRKADHILVISEFTRRQLHREMGAPLEKMTVTYNASRYRADDPLPEFPAEIMTPGTPYIIAFSSFSPHKNVPRLVDAFNKAVKERDLPHRIVLIGNQPPDLRIESDRVIATGFIPDAQVHALLAHAQMLVFPSLYEGFGMPVLEAMACGVPVACSNTASLPEIAGDAALLFEATSTHDIANAIESLATNAGLRDELRAKGYENVKRFSWKKTAIATEAIYRKVLES